MAIYALGDSVPNIDPTAYVHPDATVIGNVTVGPESTVWPQTVLRGDYGYIEIGARTSIQDGSVVHTTARTPTIVGDDCVIGHLVHLECCTVENGALVGTGAIVLHDAVIESGAWVGAGAVVPNRMIVPSGAMALGVPAKLREGVVDAEEIQRMADLYVANATRYHAELRRVE
jgi:carbonic anhydrase/acetyltransferase-like protein (isoleucine patch superfamily)